MPPITLCIVNHNGARYLADALQAAITQSGAFAEILLVDNASTDGSIDLVRRLFPQIRTLVLNDNRGPGVARNAGFTAASSDLILFQDNDVRLQPGCVAALSAVLEAESKALAVAPRVVYEQTPEVIQYDSADCHFLGLMSLRNANCPVTQAASTRSRTTSLVTACFLIDRRRWPAAQLFDEDFIFNLEDHDFGVRANLRGLQTWVEPRAVVRHRDGTAGLSYRPGQAVASRRMYCLIRNRWLIIAKSYALRTLLLLSPVLLLYEVLQLAGLSSRGWLREWWQALGFLVRGLPLLRRKRAAVQATRRASDRELLRSGPLSFTAAVRSGRLAKLAITLLEGIANGYWKVVRTFI